MPSSSPSVLRPGPGPVGPPRGLTLVELLVSIAIVATLAALLVPTIANAMRAARNAAIKAEIDMLNTAILNYRSECGEVPPCIDTTYMAGQGPYRSDGQAARHIQRLFPRCVPPQGPAWQLNQLGQRAADPSDQVWKAKLAESTIQLQTTSLGLVPNTALTLWLAGFTPDPRSPLVPASARVKLFDFDTSRRSSIGQYAPSKKPKSPFIYIDAANYDLLPYTHPSISVPGAFCRPVAGRPTPPGLSPSELSAWQFSREPLNGNAAVRASQEFFNPDTCQIICAGLDEQFGTDDDLSNFWPGTRKEYLDGLQ